MPATAADTLSMIRTRSLSASRNAADLRLSLYCSRHDLWREDARVGKGFAGRLLGVIHAGWMRIRHPHRPRADVQVIGRAVRRRGDLMRRQRGQRARIARLTIVEADEES